MRRRREKDVVLLEKQPNHGLVSSFYCPMEYGLSILAGSEREEAGRVHGCETAVGLDEGVEIFPAKILGDVDVELGGNREE